MATEIKIKDADLNIRDFLRDKMSLHRSKITARNEEVPRNMPWVNVNLQDINNIEFMTMGGQIRTNYVFEILVADRSTNSRKNWERVGKHAEDVFQFLHDDLTVDSNFNDSRITEINVDPVVVQREGDQQPFERIFLMHDVWRVSTD